MKARQLILLAAACILPTATQADLLVAGFVPDAVYRFDSSGASLGVFASHPTLMNGPTAMVYNSAGNLLVLNEFSLNVLKFDGVTGAYLGTHISSSALGSVGLTNPADMEIGLDGNLYMMGHGSEAANIFKFDGLTGSYLGVFAGILPARHQHGLAFGPGGHLYQGNVVSGLVEKFNGITGVSMGSFTSASVGPIGDIIFGPTELYVACGSGGGLARFDATTGLSLGYLIAPGSSAWGMTIIDGILYVSNPDTGEIRKYDTATDAFLGDFIAIGPGGYDLLMMPVPKPGSATLLFTGLVIFLVAVRRLNRR